MNVIPKSPNFRQKFGGILMKTSVSSTNMFQKKLELSSYNSSSNILKKKKDENEAIFKRGDKLIKILSEGITEKDGIILINSNLFLNFEQNKPQKPKVINRNKGKEAFNTIYQKKFTTKPKPKKTLEIKTNLRRNISTFQIKTANGYFTDIITTSKSKSKMNSISIKKKGPFSPDSKGTSMNGISTTRTKSNISISSLKSASLSKHVNSFRKSNEQMLALKSIFYQK